MTWLDDAERESNEFGYADGLHPDTFRRLIKVARAAEAVLSHAPMGHHLAASDEEWHAELRALRSLLREDEP